MNNWVAFTGLMLALLVNGAALVWGASKMSATIANLQKTAAKFELFIEDLAKVVNIHDGRILVLEDRTRRRPEPRDDRAHNP